MVASAAPKRIGITNFETNNFTKLSFVIGI
jgi:hypothetical protein